MWPFNRRKNQSSVPDEIQEYYQSERRERTGIAWLLALGTLIVTVILAVILFFGGRWIYRTVFDSGEAPGSGITEQEQGDDSETEEEENGSENGNDEAPTQLPGDGSNDDESEPDIEPAPSPAPTPGPEQTPSTGEQVLPNTGDDPTS